MGPSGSGKTTLLTIAGLIDTPTEGQIYLNDTLVSSRDADLDSLRAFRREHVGFVFQRANLIPFLTALENVRIAMDVNSVDPETSEDRAWDLLEQMGIAHRAEAFPRQMSGGEQQRVAVARALANHPTLIFADEPTGALDSERGRDVMLRLRRLADEDGVAVCVVTHDTRLGSLFDRTITISDGRVVHGPRGVGLSALA